MASPIQPTSMLQWLRNGGGPLPEGGTPTLCRWALCSSKKWWWSCMPHPSPGCNGRLMASKVLHWSKLNTEVLGIKQSPKLLSRWTVVHTDSEARLHLPGRSCGPRKQAQSGKVASCTWVLIIRNSYKIHVCGDVYAFVARIRFVHSREVRGSRLTGLLQNTGRALPAPVQSGEGWGRRCVSWGGNAAKGREKEKERRGKEEDLAGWSRISLLSGTAEPLGQRPARMGLLQLPVLGGRARASKPAWPPPCTEEQWPVVLSSSAASKASPRHCWLGEQLLSTGLCVPGRHAGMGTGPFQQSRQKNAAAATADAIATAAICLALRHCCRGPSRAAAAICTRLGTAGTPSPGLQVPSIHTTVKALTATFTSALCVCQQNIHSKQWMGLTGAAFILLWVRALARAEQADPLSGHPSTSQMTASACVLNTAQHDLHKGQGDGCGASPQGSALAGLHGLSLGWRWGLKK